uniref:Uncharacterized protein n=1 Tax=Meloidogyne incognita TaxID=6306 RepID=A0A914LCH5_MELIC
MFWPTGPRFFFADWSFGSCILFIPLNRSKSLLILGHFKNLFSGFPPVIYLILNKTVRNDTKALFKKIFSSLKIVKDSSVGSNNQQNIKNNTWM